MRIFKIKKFARFAQDQGISDEMLVALARRALNGLIDADLGGGVIKQRLARKGEGRSGGYRTIIAFRAHHRTFFLHGYAKNQTENLTLQELRAFKKAAKIVLELSELSLQQQLNNGTIIEVEDHE